MATLKQQVVSLAKRGALKEALALAQAAVAQDPQSADAWSVLSHAFELVKDIESALNASTHAVELAPDEPAYRFQRGWLHLMVDASADALDDLQTVLIQGRVLGNIYYAETAAFLAAETLRRLRRYAEALDMCAEVREDFSVYVGGPLTKADLVKACTRALKHSRALAA